MSKDFKVLEYELAYIKDENIKKLLKSDDFTKREELDVLEDGESIKKYRYIISNLSKDGNSKDIVMIIDTYTEPNDKNGHKIEKSRIICKGEKIFKLIEKGIERSEYEDDNHEVYFNSFIPGGITSVYLVSESLNGLVENNNDLITVTFKDVKIDFSSKDGMFFCKKINYRIAKNYKKAVCSLSEVGVHIWVLIQN